ncbi:NADAR family protein [Sulfitobacter porphyrae]|uniref:NADAR family protein n=2 Tax=Sulfitobacter porphyrae TaxID=1246864 RepID=A0ABW2B5V1_9RHOB
MKNAVKGGNEPNLLAIFTSSGSYFAMHNEPENTVYFYAQTDAFSEFSNFSPYGVAFDGRWWRTVEHYFQAMKFRDEEYRERIRNCGKPKDAKALGMTRKIPLRPDWEDVKDAIMLDAVRCKFQTHEHPRKLLLSTGDSRIAENAPMDAYWGIGPDGAGLNRLGTILMQVREELQTDRI